MNTLHNHTIPMLLSELVLQYPLQPSVIGHCQSCYGVMIFSPLNFYCKNCIRVELNKRNINKNRVDDLVQRLERAQKLQQEIRDLVRELGQ